MEAAFSTRAALEPSPRSRWTGRIVGGVPVLFLVFDAAMKLANIAPVREATERLGLPISANTGLGFLLLACVALYVTPRTAPLGAVLTTGYLGGAVAIHLRVGDPLATHTLFPVYVGALLWLGLALRDARVRSLLAGA